jgi:sugar phosphate isomerase/epimerase
MKFGCSTLLFGGFDRLTALRSIKEAGYEAVELGGIPGLGRHFRTGESPEVYRQIQDELAQTGLAVESVGVGALEEARWEALIPAVAAVGAPCITVNSGGLPNDQGAWARMVQHLQAALPRCEAAGVSLALKPHVRSTVASVDSARRLMEELDSPWVGLNLDNTHFARSGDDPVTAVEALRPWVLAARIRDYRSDDLSIGLLEHQIPGKGQADVQGYYEALTQVPGLQYVVVEMVGTRELELAEVQRIVGETIIVLRSYQG